MITDPDPKFVTDIFSIDSRDVYVIPKYQRDFTWESKHWIRLYNDIKKNQSHFLGAIICIEREIRNKISYYEIVDGQQRVTTLSLFIAAFYKKMLYLERDHSFSTSKEREDFQDERKNLGRRILRNGILRLQLAVINDNEKDFENILKEVGIIDSPIMNIEYKNRRLYEAFSYLSEKLSNKKFNEVNCLLENLKNVHVIQIKADTDSSAFSIFESLNNTGQPLGPLDLIKNKFFRELEGYNQKLKDLHTMDYQDRILSDENALDYWKNIFKNIDEKEGRVSFLKHYAATYKIKDRLDSRNITIIGKNTNERLIEMYEKFVEIDPIRFLKQLSEKSNYYTYFTNPEERCHIQEIKNELILLKYISAVPARTFLLYLFTRYENDRVLQKDVLNILIKYFIRHHVTQYPDNRKLNKIFLDLIEELMKNGPIDKTIIESYLNVDDKRSDIDKFVTGLKELKYSTSNTNLIRSVFWIIEDPYRSVEHPKNFFEKTDGENPEFIWTLEHIMPQTLTPSWEITLHLTEGQNAAEIHKKWLHSIGNLTLTGYNRNLFNKPFLEKLNYGEQGIPKGLKNGIFLNQEFENWIEDRWSENDIESRRNRLIENIKTHLKFSGEH
jgi:uncharacterized protein with ParB-like and HNH nuclease domain